jgi:hypothetical protein
MTAGATHPDHAAAFVAALLDPAVAAPAGLKTWSGCDPSRRFDVHRNNVRSSLVSVLAATFPVSQAVVGEDFFRAMAAIWVIRSPPLSPVLSEYGSGFPEFIAGFAPAAALPFLGELARLEWLRNVSYHAADSPTLDGDAYRPWLARPAQLDALRVQLHPACHWLRCGYPVLSIWSAHHGHGALAAIEPGRGEDVLVFRPGEEVRLLELPAGGVDFLDALQRGCPLAEAAAVAGKCPGFDLTANLRGLVEHRLASAFLDAAATAL